MMSFNGLVKTRAHYVFTLVLANLNGFKMSAGSSDFAYVVVKICRSYQTNQLNDKCFMFRIFLILFSPNYLF